MHRIILAAVLTVAGCATADRTTTFRDSGAPIWSAAVLAPERLAGTWQQVASFSSQDPDCAQGSLELRPVASGVQMAGSLCLDGKTLRLDTLARPAGPGRLSVAGQDDWWILWVDEGYRTLAVGTPSGRFGFVLDRATGAADRLQAAREVFDFNGYDTAQFLN